MTEETAIVGLGNTYRNDDAVGILAVEKIKSELDNKFQYFSESENDVDSIILHLALNDDIKEVIFIDAGEMDGKPGDFQWIKNSQGIVRSISTHNVALPVYFEYLKNYGKKVKLLAIQPEILGYEEGLSRPIKEFIDTKLVKLFE
jgi:hydrogenase maturation protease